MMQALDPTDGKTYCLWWTSEATLDPAACRRCANRPRRKEADRRGRGDRNFYETSAFFANYGSWLVCHCFKCDGT